MRDPASGVNAFRLRSASLALRAGSIRPDSDAPLLEAPLAARPVQNGFERVTVPGRG